MAHKLLVIMVAAAAMAFGGTAQAQTVSAPSRGYAEFNAQSAFGNVTSQNFGGELGFTIAGPWQVWVEGGRTRDVTPAAVGAEAQQVAGALAQQYSGIGYGIKEPVTFGVGGIRYVIPMQSRFVPYIVGGVGAAQVSPEATYSLNGGDITSALATQYGTVLGSQLSGNSTHAMMVLGGGVQLPLWQWLVADLQYRYGRIFTPGTAINVNRAGIGIGVRF